MLTYRTGAAGTPSGAMSMAAHLLRQTLPLVHAKLAAYYQRAPIPVSDHCDVFGNAIAEVRADIDPRLASHLGLSPDRTLRQQEIAQLLAGRRADGQPIAGKQVQGPTRSLGEELGLRIDRMPFAGEIEQVLAGVRADNSERLPEGRARQLQSRLLALYGAACADNQRLSETALRHIVSGRRADGTPVRQGPFLDSLSATRARISYIDLCWSADKSVSLAWAFAPTEAERNLIATAHKEAVASAMLHVEAEIGRARKGKAGRAGYERGSLAWVAFDHYTSRPTTEIVRNDPNTGEPYTEFLTLRVAGTPQLHTHVCVPAVLLTESGRLVSPDLRRLRVHEFGRVYQAFLAGNLLQLGVEVSVDIGSGAARVKAIPDNVRAAFSDRTQTGTDAARAYARDCGLDWDLLDDTRKIGLIKRGVQGNPRQAKTDDVADWVAWRQKLSELGWEPRSVLDLNAPVSPLEQTARLEHAYHVASEVLEQSLRRCAVLDEADVRSAAASGLVAAGIETPADIDAVVQILCSRGVRQDGEVTRLIWSDAVNAQGYEHKRFTTVLHANREAELVALAKAAAADREGALSPIEINDAIARSQYDFATTEHGRTQAAVLRKLGEGGRFSVAIGVAGAGKSALIAPLVACYSGQAVYGAALAWRQSTDLVAAGISEDRCLALSVFVERVRSGEIEIDTSGILIVDEISLVSTKILLDLLRLRAEYGFRIAAVGDPLQCQSPESGPVIELLRRALGPDAIPEILTTVRQQSERERETTLLFRQGRAAEALEAKREDSTARLAPGDYDQVVKSIAALWRQRRDANANDPNYTLSVSAPTNSDARAISAAIRMHRRAQGEVGVDQVVLSACDQVGNAFDLPLAVGDRVRLFNRVNASYADKRHGLLGNNGSVLEVISIGKPGITLRNARNSVGLVSWDTLRDPESGRIRLTYGDVLTVDSSQGLTSTEHIEAMPAGTAGVNAYKAYTASSRHRRTTYIIFSDGAERREIARRRPLGDTRRITERDVWANIARNLSRQPEQESALAFLERAHQVRQNARRAFQIAMQRIEQRMVDHKRATTLTFRWQWRRQMVTVLELVYHLREWLEGRDRMIPDLSQMAHEDRRRKTFVLRRGPRLAYKM